MTMTTKPTKVELERQAKELAATWVLVGTNQGTYGAADACRAIGTGDPRHADCNIYEQVGTGERRVDGPDIDAAPGRIRRFNSELATKQAALAELRRQIRAGR